MFGFSGKIMIISQYPLYKHGVAAYSGSMADIMGVAAYGGCHKTSHGPP
jgi:hypothetical protein